MLNKNTLDKNTNDRKVFQRKLLAIAIPIMLSNLISQIQMLIDRVFLGRLDITAMSAVSNASSPMWTTMDLVFTLAVGSNILISQAIGAGEKERAKALMEALFKYANFLALALFCVWMFLPRLIFTLMKVDPDIIDMSISYARYFAPIFLFMGIGSAISTLLEVSEKTGIMIAYGIIRSLINIFLDYCLVFGNLGFPRMEVAGAALATTIAELTGDMVIFVYVIANKNLWLKPRIKAIFQAKLKPYIQSVRMGLPTALEGFAWNLGSLFLIVMLNHISKTAAGIYSIIFGMELLPVCLIGSLSTGVLTLSGQETGRKNLLGLKKIVRIAMIWSLSLSAAILILFILFPRQLTGFFTTDQEVIEAAVLYLVIVGIDLFPKSANIIVGSGIKGYGDTKWMLYTQIFGTCFVMGVSAILVLLLNRGIAALFCLVVADETLRAIVNIWKLNRITKKKIVDEEQDFDGQESEEPKSEEQK